MSNQSYNVTSSTSRVGGLHSTGMKIGNFLDTNGSKLRARGVKNIDSPLGAVNVLAGGALRTTGEIIKENPSAATVGLGLGAAAYVKNRHDKERMMKYPALYQD